MLTQSAHKGAAQCHLQISDLALDWPSRAQWLPKCTSWKTPGKCSSTQASVGCWMQCCREVTTTRSQLLRRRCRLWYAPAYHHQPQHHRL